MNMQVCDRCLTVRELHGLNLPREEQGKETTGEQRQLSTAGRFKCFFSMPVGQMKKKEPNYNI